jgi:hypothetical protein
LSAPGHRNHWQSLKTRKPFRFTDEKFTGVGGYPDGWGEPASGTKAKGRVRGTAPFALYVVGRGITVLTLPA